MNRADLSSMISRARESNRDHEALRFLASVLGESMGQEAHKRFTKEFRPEGIYYDDLIAPGGFVDYERTAEAHYGKYQLYKFASFLDLLRPGVIYWQGQSDPHTMSWAHRGMERFLKADLAEREAMLSRWMKQPGSNAFSERAADRGEEIRRRREFLRSLPRNLRLGMVAVRLDQAGFKPRKYESFSQWCLMNEESFQSWLSRERRAAEDESKAH